MYIRVRIYVIRIRMHAGMMRLRGVGSYVGKIMKFKANISQCTVGRCRSAPPHRTLALNLIIFPTYDPTRSYT